MKAEEKKYNVSLNVEWRNKYDANALAAALLRNGAKSVRVYDCPYTDDRPVTDYGSLHTEFAICGSEDYPVSSILADVAMYPSVLSVGETESPGLVERIIRRIFK